MSKSSRYWLRLTTAFINRFKLIFLIGIASGLFGFFVLTYLIPLLSLQTEKIGVVGEYTITNLPDSVLTLIGSGLTKLAPSGQVNPAIATSWEVADSGNKSQTWTFHLKHDLKWQDGSNLTANDIKYSFSDAVVTIPDKYTMRFKLTTAFAPFPTTLSKPVFKKGLLGTGEWKVSNLTLAGNFVETLTLTNNNKSQKIFKFYPTEDRAKLAFELGQVDKIDDLLNITPFDKWSAINVTKLVNKQRYVAVFFNTKDDLLIDKDIRQALSYGIDKAQFGTSRALGPISPISWAYNPSVKPYDHDIEHAKELISSSKIDPSQKKDLKITLTTVPDLLSIANLIAKNWKEIGVTTTISVTQFVPENHQAFLAIYNIPTDPDQYTTWHSTQVKDNISHYQNKRIDKLLEDGRLETNEEKRKQVYFDFQRFLIEDAPAAFLYYPNSYSVKRK